MTTHHAKLYKLSSIGQIWEWHIESKNDRYRMHSGILDGAITVSNWTVCEGKNVGRTNETSPSEQCDREVEAAYTLKLKKGYAKSVEALKKNSKTKFSPMLAKDFNAYREHVFDDKHAVFTNPKLDGIRLIAKKDGLWSRAGNRILSLRHIEQALAPVFKENPDLILDGEAYSHELKHDFNKIVSLVKKIKPTEEDFAAAAEQIQYWVYDLVSDEEYSNRASKLAKIAKSVGKPLVMVQPRPCKSQSDLESAHAEYLDNGFEGTIVRVDSECGYEQKRTKNLLKYKNFQDAEFEIVSIEEGIGNRSGMAGFANLKDSDGKTFKANIKGDREFLRGLLEKRTKLIGKQATVEFFNLTPAGIPRFPRIKAIHETKRW